MPILSLARGALDLDTGVLVTDDDPVTLTDTERRLVAFLASQPGAVDRDTLQQAVWGYRPGILSRTVFTTIGRVRSKVEVDPRRPSHLLTVPGEGYRWVGREPSAEPSPPLHAAAQQTMVGRDADLVTVRSLLDSGARLVTLHGPGGVGKTRLAQAVGPMATAWLEACVDEAGFAAGVAEALGVALGPRGDQLTELLQRARGASGVLVLDNLEHLLPRAAPWVDRLIGGLPGVQLLVTSRQRLGLRGEHVFLVGDLALPRDGHDLDQAPAGELLLAAAQRSRAGWAPTPGERQALAKLCAEVGGNPLALELAASWLRLLEPGELLGEVQQSNELLRARHHDAPPKHRSVAATLDASWGLLDPGATDILEQLGVFTGPVPRSLVRQTTGADLLRLGQLVDAALLRRVPQGFDLHPLIRRHARDRLAADPARERATRRAHQRAVLAHLRAAVDTAALEALAPLAAEIRAAWWHAAACGDVATLVEHAGALHRWLDVRQRPREAIELVMEAAARLERSEEDTSTVAPVAASLRLLAIGAGGPPPENLPQVVGQAAGVIGPLGVLARIHGAIGSHLVGEPAWGLAWTAEALERTAEPSLRAFALGVRGSLLLRSGRVDDARQALEEALEAAPNAALSGRCLVHLGQVALAAGDVASCREHLWEAIVRLRRRGDGGFVVMGLTTLAEAESADGGDPRDLLEEALHEAEHHHLPPTWTAPIHVHLAERHLLADAPRSAARHLYAADCSLLAFANDRQRYEAVTRAVETTLSAAERARLREETGQPEG